MSTIIIAIAMLVFITLIVALLMFVHDRDKKKEAAKKMEASGTSDLT
jgi:heme/copper-type cytochrome/quinol oxidase subunit 4